MHMYRYIYIYMYTYVYDIIYHLCRQIHTHTHTHIYVVHAQRYSHTYIHTKHIHTYTHKKICTNHGTRGRCKLSYFYVLLTTFNGRRLLHSTAHIHIHTKKHTRIQQDKEQHFSPCMLTQRLEKCSPHGSLEITTICAPQK